MNAKIKVTFDMAFATDGECKTQVSFELPEHPDTPCPDNLKKILIGEIKMLCGAMDAAGAQLFSANAPDQRRDESPEPNDTKKPN